MEQDLTLREALAEDRLDDFVRQEEDRGVELAKGSDLERALALLVTQRRLEARSARSTAHGGEWAQRGADRSRHRTSYSAASMWEAALHPNPRSAQAWHGHTQSEWLI